MQVFSHKVKMFFIIFIFSIGCIGGLYAQENQEQDVNKSRIEQLATCKQENGPQLLDSLLKEKDKLLPLLLDSLNHENYRVRLCVVHLLAQDASKRREVIPALIKRLEQEKETVVMRQLVAALSRVGERETFESLYELLNHSDLMVRLDVVRALTLLPEIKAAGKLVEHLKKEKVPEMQGAILQALAQLQDERAIARALLLVGLEDVTAQKPTFLNALGECAASAHSAQGQLLLAEIATEALDLKVREYALRLLLPALSRSNVSLIIPALEDRDIDLRRQAYRKFVELTLRSLGYSPEAAVLERALAVARWQKWADIEDLAAELLHKPSQKIVRTLIAQGDLAVATLLDIYQEANEQTRGTLVEILQKISWQRLLRLYNDNKSNADVAKIMAAAFTANAQEWWAYQLACLESKERVAADETLGIVSIKDSLDFLGKAAGDKKMDLFAASEFLLAVKDVAAWDILIAQFPALTNEQKIELIGQLETARYAGVEKLLGYMEKEEEPVQIVLCKAVAAVKSQDARPALIKMLGAEYRIEVQKAAIDSLRKMEALGASDIKNALLKEGRSDSQLLLLQTLCQVEKLEALLQLATESNTSLKNEWLKELAKMTGWAKEHAAAVGELIAKESDSTRKSLAIELAGKFAYDSASPMLLKLLKEDADASCRKLALTKLTMFNKPEVAQELENLLKDAKDSEWQNELRDALAKAAPAKALPLVEQAVIQAPQNIRALTLLSTINAARATEMAQANWAKLSDDKQKVAVLQALRQAWNAGHVAWLLQQFAAAAPEVRGELAAVLDTITGVKSGYRADLSEEEQKKISLPWQLWDQEQALLTGMVHGLLAAKPGVEQDKARQELLAYKEKAVNALGKVLPEQKNIDGKQLIVDALGMSGQPQAIALVRPVLQESQAELRSAAYVALARLDAAQTALELPVWYVKENSPRGRLVLIDLMWQHKVTFVTDSWQEYLTTTDDSVAASLIRLFKKYPNNFDKPALLARLAQMNEAVRVEAIELLKSRLQVADLPVVAGIFAGQNDKVQQAMLPLLAQFVDVPADKAKDAKAFLAWWNDKNIVRERAEIERVIADMLTGDDTKSEMAKKELEKATGDMRKYVQEKLVALLQNPETATVGKERMVNLLAAYADAANIPLFTAQLASEQPGLRRVAARGLYRLGYAVAGKQLGEIVKHQDANVRFFAVKALSESGDKKVLPALVKAIADNDVRVREEALAGALQFGFDDGQSLRALVKDQGPAVRVMAIQRSAELKLNDMVEPLVAYLSDPFPTVRRAAHEALRSLTGQTIAYAAEESRENRAAAIQQWYGWLERKKALQDLKTLADRFTEEGIKSEEVRTRMIERYNQIPADTRDEAKAVLLSLLRSPKNLIRLEMVQVLATLNDRSFGPSLAESLADTDMAVRQAAWQAVQKLSSDKLELTLAEETEKQWPQEVKKLEAWWPEKVKSGVNVQELQKKLDEVCQNATKEKREVVLAQLGEIAFDAPELVKALLKDSRRDIAILAAHALLQLRALDCLSEMLPLLSDANNRAALRQAIEETIGGKLPMANEDVVSKEAYLGKLMAWWKDVERDYNKNAVAATEKGLQEVNANADKFKETAQTLVAFGPAMRIILEDYLADTRPAVRNTVIYALSMLNDRRSIPALLDSMRDGDQNARTTVRAAIYAISRKRLSEAPEPQSDREWDSEYMRIRRWWNEWETAYPGEMKSAWQQVVATIADPNQHDKAVQQIIAEGPGCYLMLADLLKSDKREERLAALKAMNTLKFNGVVPALIPFMTDSDNEVQKSVAETLAVVSGVSVPQPDSAEVVWQKEVERLQSWWQQYRQNVPVVDESALQNILLALADGKMSKEDGKKGLVRLGLGVGGLLPKYAKAQEDSLRLGAVRACAILRFVGNDKLWQEMLLDGNLKVRQEAVTSLQTLVGDKEKLPFVFDDKAEADWQKKVGDWLPVWKEKQHKAAREIALAQLDKDSTLISKATDIGNRDELEAARKVSQYLKSPYKDVATKAWDVLKNVAKGQFSFRLDGTSQEQLDDIKEMTQRFDEKAKKLEEDEKNIEEKLRNLDNQWLSATSPIGIMSPEQGEKLRDLLQEMVYDSNSHPLLQKKYLEILQKNECAPANYNVYADRKTREDALYKVSETIYERQKALAVAALEGKKLEESLGDVFTVVAINSDKDIKAVRRLIDLLSHAWLPLRNKAIQTLGRVAGDSKGYRADASNAINQKAIEAWQQWANEEEMQLNQKRNAQLDKMKAAVAEMAKTTTIDNRDQLDKVALLVAAIKENDTSLREQSLTILKALNNGETFGYKSDVVLETLSDSIMKWNQWYIGLNAQLKELETVRQLVARAAAAGKVQTAEQVADLVTIKELLASPQLAIRQLVLATLADYVRKYASEEVRDNFGYDPQAADNARIDSKKLWDAWFTNKIVPVAEAEKTRRQQIQELAGKFPQGKIASAVEWEAAAGLVKALEDASKPVRHDALGGLLKLTAGETYGFVAEFSPENQKQAIAYWQWWLKAQKRSLDSKK